MTRKMACLSALICFAAMPTMLRASINVEINGNALDPIASGTPITPSLSNGVAYTIRVWADDPTSEDVGLITINDPGGNSLVTILFATTGGYSEGQVAAVCRHWAGLANNKRGTRLSGRINGNLTGNVIVSQIARFEVGGSVNASVTCGFDSSDTGGSFIMVAGAFGESGEAKANAGDISLVQVIGNMLGDLRAPNGQIVTIDVGGNIGSSSRLSTITARVQADDDLNEAFELIRADNIYANITGTADVSWLGRLETTGSPGDFVGSLTIDHINWKQSDPAPGIYLTGDLDANVTFGSGLSSPIEIGGDLAEGGVIAVPNTVTTIAEIAVPDRYGHIYIKGSLLGNIEIGEETAKGVRGFIEFNTANASGVWTGDVEVRTPSGIETLSSVPAYSQLSSEITESGY